MFGVLGGILSNAKGIDFCAGRDSLVVHLAILSHETFNDK